MKTFVPPVERRSIRIRNRFNVAQDKFSDLRFPILSQAASRTARVRSGATLRNCNKKDRDIDLTIPITSINRRRFVAARQK
ncbi:MAG: hypothetical protein DME96_02790 [Verrucomicrobia bacterium]|nr:MAG: hypothetical protein DME96_02790 [Verrucomicrobiota bacterium]